MRCSHPAERGAVIADAESGDAAINIEIVERVSFDLKQVFLDINTLVHRLIAAGSTWKPTTCALLVRDDAYENTSRTIEA